MFDGLLIARHYARTAFANRATPLDIFHRSYSTPPPPGGIYPTMIIEGPA
jgi:hypothetical protein